MTLHYCNEHELVPVDPMCVYPCVLGVGNCCERPNTALSIRGDYLARRDRIEQALALVEPFAVQFLTDIDPTAAFYIEEARMDEWLHVMRMLSKVA